jgi:hypothetical protein
MKLFGREMHKTHLVNKRLRAVLRDPTFLGGREEEERTSLLLHIIIIFFFIISSSS